jgi:hypothetical protein
MQVIGLTTMLDQKTLLELGCVQAVDDFKTVDYF